MMVEDNYELFLLVLIIFKMQSILFKEEDIIFSKIAYSKYVSNDISLTFYYVMIREFLQFSLNIYVEKLKVIITNYDINIMLYTIL